MDDTNVKPIHQGHEVWLPWLPWLSLASFCKSSKSNQGFLLPCCIGRPCCSNPNRWNHFRLTQPGNLLHVWWFTWEIYGKYGDLWDIPSGNDWYIAMENGHRHSEFSHLKWWFSIAICNSHYQRVPKTACLDTCVSEYSQKTSHHAALHPT